MTLLMDSVLTNVRDARSSLPRDPAGTALQDQAQCDWHAHLEALGFERSAAVGEMIVAASAIMAKRLDELAARSGLEPEAADLGHAVLGEAAFIGLALCDGED